MFKISDGLTQLRKSYEVEVSTSSKRQTSDMEDGDTRQVVVMKKRRDTSASPPPSSSAAAYPDYYESPPASQAVPWEIDDDDDNDDFQFSPASPLTQSTKREETAPPSPTLYVFPEASVLLMADCGAVRIPDRSANQSSTSQREDSPEPSTSQTYSSEEEPEVCKIMIEEAVSKLIIYTWRRSDRTFDEVTKTIFEEITATIMSPEWHELRTHQRPPPPPTVFCRTKRPCYRQKCVGVHVGN